MIKPCVFHQIIHGHRRHTPPSGSRASMSSGSRPAGPALGHDWVRGGGGVQVRAVRNGALGHPAVIWAGDTVAANNAPIMTTYVSFDDPIATGCRTSRRRVHQPLRRAAREAAKPRGVAPRAAHVCPRPSRGRYMVSCRQVSGPTVSCWAWRSLRLEPDAPADKADCGDAQEYQDDH